MQPRKPRRQRGPVNTGGPVIVKDDVPLLYYRLQDGQIQTIETSDHAAAAADLRGKAWALFTPGGQPLAMTEAMAAALKARELSHDDAGQTTQSQDQD